MSEKVTIEKKVDVDFGEAGNHEIDSLIEVQVDYVQCEECGESVDFSLESDSYGDIQITFKPCSCGNKE